MSGFGMALVNVAHAQSGTWTSTASGNWSGSANWDAAVVADGASNTANFNTIDIPAGVLVVTLDTSRTIGSLTTGDSNTGTAGTWQIAGANTLTLSATTPTITTNVNTRIDPILTGTAGFKKEGSGILTLTNANTYTGNVTLSAGQLTTKNSAAIPTASTLNMSSGTTYRIERTTANATTFQGFAISVAASSSATMTTDNAANGYSGLISGDASSTFTIGGSGATTQVSMNLGSNTQQFGNFLGTVKIFDGASLRFSATSGVNNGGSSATFDVGAGSDLTTRNAATVNVGALTGSGFVTGSGGATGTANFSIGAKNISTTFTGVIRDGNAATSRFASMTKVGTGTLTLSGTNTYTGATSVSAGTLLVTGALGNTAVNVGASGTIGGSGTLGGNLTISAGGNLDVTGGNLSTGAGLLTVDATKTITLNGFSFSDIVGWDAANAADGTYTLINGASSVTFAGATPTEASPFWFIADVKKGYFRQGSLQAVIVTIPETSAAVLGAFGGLLLLRRRRA